jgi:CheY-like chemotaxis protein
MGMMLGLCNVADSIDFSDYILLAEDNPADVRLVREALEDRAVTYRLHVAADGDQAIKFIEQVERNSTASCPKLLLLDLHLPGQDGEAILRRLRASERCGQTPVVILTSSDSPRDREKAAANAALHYFCKPSTLEQFLQLGDIVAAILDSKSPPTVP